MIRGVGIDLVGVERIREMMERGLVARYYTPEEQRYIADKGAAAAQSAAGMFAAKEAMLKALGTGIAGIGLLDVSTAHDERGAPVAVLEGKAAARLREIGATRMLLSITHAEGMAAAVAIAEEGA